MKIVIVGAGQVGSHLAKLLSGEEQDITLIDDDAQRLAVLDANYNLLTITGSATSFGVMREAGVERCDLFIAVTTSEATNVIACSMAKSLGAIRTVARIDNYEFMKKSNADFFNRLGVNALIYPEYLAATEILQALERNWVRNWFELHDGELIVVGVKIRDNARIAGLQLREISMTEHSFHVSAIKRYHDTIIPRGDDYVLPGDILYITTRKENIDTLREACGKTEIEIRKVMVMCGNRIAAQLAIMGGNKYRFKIIDDDLERCNYISTMCDNCDVIHGDARDIETLIDEGIGDMDAFIALSDSSEANILTCLSSKEYGVKKTVAEVENIQFISEAENLNIGTIINKKLSASSKIFQLLLDADHESSKFLALADADVAEIEVHEKSKVTKGPVKTLNLSRDMTIAGLIRDGRGILVDGNTQVMAGDHVVVFCLAGSIHKVEKLFV